MTPSILNASTSPPQVVGELVIPWIATTGRSVFTSGTIPSVVGSIGSLQEAQIRWERSISSETNSSLWPPPYG